MRSDFGQPVDEQQTEGLDKGRALEKNLFDRNLAVLAIPIPHAIPAAVSAIVWHERTVLWIKMASVAA